MVERNNHLEKYFYLLSLFLLFSVPFGYFWGSLSFILWFSFSVLWGIKLKKFQFNSKALPFLLFSIIILLSLLWSQDKDLTRHALVRQLPLVLFPITTFFLPKLSYDGFKKMFQRFSILMSILATILIFLAFIRYQKYQYKGFLYYHELVSFLNLNAIYVSYIISVCFIFLIQNFDKKNMWQLPAIIVLGSFLVMLSSKMILVTTLLILLIIFMSRFKSNLQKALIIFGLLVSIIIVYLYAQPIKNRFSSEFNSSASEILWEESFEKGRVYTGFEARLLQVRVFNEIIDTPFEYILGVGLDASKNQIAKIHKRLNTPEVFQTYNFHNQYLQVSSELGLLGLLLLLMMLTLGFNQSFKNNVFLPFMIITFALFFSESVIWRQRGIMFFGIMYVLLLTINKENESKK